MPSPFPVPQVTTTWFFLYIASFLLRSDEKKNLGAKELYDGVSRRDDVWAPVYRPETCTDDWIIVGGACALTRAGLYMV